MLYSVRWFVQCWIPTVHRSSLLSPLRRSHGLCVFILINTNTLRSLQRGCTKLLQLHGHCFDYASLLAKTPAQQPCMALCIWIPMLWGPCRGVVAATYVQSAKVNAIYNLHCAMCNRQSTIHMHCAMCDRQVTIHIVQSTIYNPHCTMCNLQSTIHIVQCPINNLQSTIHIVQSAIYNPQSKIYTVDCIDRGCCRPFAWGGLFRELEVP